MPFFFLFVFKTTAYKPWDHSVFGNVLDGLDDGGHGHSGYDSRRFNQFRQKKKGIRGFSPNKVIARSSQFIPNSERPTFRALVRISYGVG